MSRTALALLAAAFGLAAGFAAGLAFAGAGWATPAFAASVGFAVVTTALAVAIARRLDHRVARRLSAIGAAVGHDGMRRGREVDYVESIVTTLYGSLQRASALRAGLSRSPLLVAVVTENGDIATPSAGLLALGPLFQKGVSFPEFAALAETGEARLDIGGRAYRAVLDEEDGPRRVVSLVPEGVVADPALFDDLGEALLSGGIDADLTERLARLGPPGQALIDGFGGLGRGLRLIDGVLDGNERALAAARKRNDALGMRARAMGDLIAAFAAARAEEDDVRERLEHKLARIGELVDRHRLMAARLRDSTLALRDDGAAAGQALHAGAAGATEAVRIGAGAREAVAEARDTARLNAEWATGVGALTEEISSLVSAIEQVSFRTNLIALNASVEAARAGEKGAGFAVVADEVRTLAQSASQTAKEIRTLVAKSKSQNEHGVAGARELSRLVEGLDEHLRNLSTETDKIADALSRGKGVLANFDRKAAEIAGDADRATGGTHPRAAAAD